VYACGVAGVRQYATSGIVVGITVAILRRWRSSLWDFVPFLELVFEGFGMGVGNRADRSFFVVFPCVCVGGTGIECNVGYAFVNFIYVQDLLRFAKARLDIKW
jgi:hypothetical protein